MLRFAYQSEPIQGVSPPSLQPNALERWRPLIPVAVVGPTGKRRYYPRALLDSGADDSVFPLSATTILGVTLRPESGHGIRWRGQSYALRFGDLTLELDDGIQVFRWSAVIGFSPAPIRYPILGTAGCLQYFDAGFLGDQRVVELATNSSYRGTIT